MTEHWSLPRRIAFRFFAVVTVLLVAPFPLRLLPGTEWLERGIMRAWQVGVAWFAEFVLRIEAPPQIFTGSGDNLLDYVQLALIACVGVIATIAWSLGDRRRQNYTRLAHVLLVVVRDTSSRA